ncbi:somatostatin receptor type 5-like [Pelodytes ibericus]
MDYSTLSPLEVYFNFSDYNFTLDADFSESKISTTFCFLYALVCLVGLVGNALAIYVVLRYRHMWTATNVYIFSLALGDLLYMLCLLLFVVETAHEYWPMGLFMCQMFWALTAMISFSSAFFLIMLAMNNLARTFFPTFTSNRLGPKAAVVLSVCTWVTCILFGIPIFIYASIDHFDSCKSWSETTTMWSTAITSYQFALTFVVPLVFILTSMLLVWLKAQVKREESSCGAVQENMMLVFVLSLVYFVIWLPMHILEIMAATGIVQELSREVYYLVSIIPYLKCCIYPILYGFLSQGFKGCYNRLLCCAKV